MSYANDKTRQLECPCGADVVFPTEDNFVDVACPECGEKVADSAAAIDWAQKRMPDLAEASAVAMRFSYEHMIEMARRGYDEPDSLTSDEVDALAAFCRLRKAGLPCHAPEVGH